MADQLNLLLAALSQYEDLLGKLSLSSLFHFVMHVEPLKNDIILAQSAHYYVDASQPPMFLPPSICSFVGRFTGLGPDDVTACWDVLKDLIWDEASRGQSICSLLMSKSDDHVFNWTYEK